MDQSKETSVVTFLWIIGDFKIPRGEDKDSIGIDKVSGLDGNGLKTNIDVAA